MTQPREARRPFPGGGGGGHHRRRLRVGATSATSPALAGRHVAHYYRGRDQPPPCLPPRLAEQPPSTRSPELDDLSPAERRWRGALTLGLALYGLWCGLTPDRFHWPDAVDLPIHETGHLVFGWGGEVLAALGGTLFQLIMPLAFVGYFLRRRDVHAASVALWWVGQNCWNIARYIADARAQELPLVGGGEHDWAFLLATWDRLARDQIIARDVRLAGWILVAAAVWVGWRALDRGRGDGEMG